MASINRTIRKKLFQLSIYMEYGRHKQAPAWIPLNHHFQSIKHTAMSFYFDHHNLLIILFMWNCNPIITLITQSHRNIINCDVFTFCLNNSKYVTSKLQYTKTSCDFIVKQKCFLLNECCARKNIHTLIHPGSFFIEIVTESKKTRNLWQKMGNHNSTLRWYDLCVSSFVLSLLLDWLAKQTQLQTENGNIVKKKCWVKGVPVSI